MNIRKLLDWRKLLIYSHRWLGIAGAVGAIGAALLSSRLHVSSWRSAFAYRFLLFVTALLVAITGHLGGTLVWGAGFLRP